MQIQNTNSSLKPNILQGPSLLLHPNFDPWKADTFSVHRLDHGISCLPKLIVIHFCSLFYIFLFLRLVPYIHTQQQYRYVCIIYIMNITSDTSAGLFFSQVGRNTAKKKQMFTLIIQKLNYTFGMLNYSFRTIVFLYHVGTGTVILQVSTVYKKNPCFKPVLRS